MPPTDCDYIRAYEIIMRMIFDMVFSFLRMTPVFNAVYSTYIIRIKINVEMNIVERKDFLFFFNNYMNFQKIIVFDTGSLASEMSANNKMTNY